MKHRIAVPLSVAAGLGLAAAAFASVQAATCAASTTCSTTTQFSVNAGALTITVPDGPINLGNGTPGATIANTFTGAGGSVVTVSDLRALLTPTWTASVIATNFTNSTVPTADPVPNSNVFYASGSATAQSGGGTSTPGQATPPGESLDVSRTAFSHSGGTGNNSTSWDPTITINVPAQAVAGQYTGTINHSVA